MSIQNASSSISSFCPAYVRGKAPPDSDVPAMMKYFRDELQKIQFAIAPMKQALPQVAIVAPAKPYTGMIVLATPPWEPIANTTTPIYVYYTGSQWTAL